MFGDYNTNSKNWSVECGARLFKFSSGKFLAEEKRLEQGIPVYGGNGIAWYTNEALVNHATIIIGRVGAYCGNVKKVEEPIWITDNAIYIKEFYSEKLNLTFLYKLMESMRFSKYADFSGQPKITQRPLENSMYIVPPLSLQNEFARFVEQTDKSKIPFEMGVAT